MCNEGTDWVCTAQGWTEDALRAGAQAAGLSPASVGADTRLRCAAESPLMRCPLAGLLPRGPAELVEHFTAGCDARFAAELQSRQQELAGAPQRCVCACRTARC